MKRNLALIIFSICLVLPVMAQQPTKVSVNFMGGYAFEDNVSFSNAYGYVNDNAQYGVGIEYFVHPDYTIGLNYTRMDTQIPLYSYSTYTQLNKGSDDIDINYLLIGGTRYLTLRSPVVTPYGGIGAGMAVVHSKDGGGSLTRFAWDAKLGIKLKVGQTFGIKLQGQLQSIVQGVGGGLYVGTGGAGVDISTYSTIYQFGVTGGITIDL